MGVLYSSIIMYNPIITGRILYNYGSVRTSSPYRVYFGTYNTLEQTVDQDMSINVHEPGHVLEATAGLGCGAAVVQVKGKSTSTGPNSVTWSTEELSTIKWANNIVPNQCHDGNTPLNWLIAFYYLNSIVYGVATLLDF